MILQTDRLYLREMSEEDFDALYRVLADTDIMKHYPYTFDEERVRGWIERNINRYKDDGFGLWAVCLKETGEMIGDCGLTLQNIDGRMLPEIGYHIRKDCQRKGYAKEAAAAVRDWAFEHTVYPALYSYCKYTNEPSFKTAESIGMHFYKEYPDKENEITHVSIIFKKGVTVTVDRPLGSYHPKHKDIYYSVNYGYVEGIIAPDGEEQDVYILGIDEPIEEFTGDIIAIIHRLNDVEDKWVVASEEKEYSAEQIEKLVHFQEQYFEHEIIM